MKKTSPLLAAILGIASAAASTRHSFELINPFSGRSIIPRQKPQKPRAHGKTKNHVPEQAPLTPDKLKFLNSHELRKMGFARVVEFLPVDANWNDRRPSKRRLRRRVRVVSMLPAPVSA